MQTSTENIEKTYKKLCFLAENYDPYLQEIPENIRELLSEFDLEEDQENPFAISNQLLLKLDEIQQILAKDLHEIH